LVKGRFKRFVIHGVFVLSENLISVPGHKVKTHHISTSHNISAFHQTLRSCHINELPKTLLSQSDDIFHQTFKDHVEFIFHQTDKFFSTIAFIATNSLVSI
jgi:DNA polymerase III sliding clamp (beta) subunit (PCNA family)